MSSRFFANALTVDELAQVAALSPRQVSRAFRAETGQTPAKAVEQIRQEAARPVLEETPHPMEQVARESGFSDLDRMRESLHAAAFGGPAQLLDRLAARAVDIGHHPLPGCGHAAHRNEGRCTFRS